MLQIALSSIFQNVWISYKKRSHILNPGADHGRKIKVAGLLGQLFLEKIHNGGRRFTLDWLVSRVKKDIQHFYWLIRLSGFYLGQSYLATLVTPQNCTKCLEILLLLYKLHILASDQKKFFGFFRATFEELLFVFLSNFFEKYGKLFGFWKLFGA